MPAFSRTGPRPSTSDTATERLRAVLGLAPASTPDTKPLDESTPSSVDRQGGRWRARFARLLPAGLHGARVDPGRRGAGVLVLVVLLSAAAVGMLGWRSRPQAEPVRPPAVVTPAAADPSSATAPTMVVAVTGRVRRPGVVTLPAGARVIDAVRAAGGPSPGADLALLNLARKLADGELVVVGVPGAADPGGQVEPGAAGSKVNLNTATLEQLDGLPGVGPVLAQRILDWRTGHGPFATVDQLREVTGIGDAKFGDLRGQVTV